jgi:CheY-like chemotaxis protein
MAIRVLLVDDEKDFREIFSAWLAFKGYVVVTAEDGEDALEKLESHAFDLVLLDLMMPRVDGYEFLRRVRKNARHAGLAIVILTAVQRLSGFAKAHEAGADAFLEKLASHDEMSNTIERVVNARAASEQGGDSLQ